MNANVVTGNNMFDFMQLLYDGGAIYTQGVQQQSEISGNRIGNMQLSKLYCGYAPTGIYLDQGSDYLTVRDNLMRKVSTLDGKVDSMIKLNVGRTPLHN